MKNFVYSDFVQALDGASVPLYLDLSTYENRWTYFIVLEPISFQETALISTEVSNPTLLSLLKSVASAQNNVMLVFGTKNYLEALENFLYYAKDLGIKSLALVALDKKTVDFAQRKDTPFYAFLDDDITALGGSDSYASDAFRRVVNKRSSLVSAILGAGFNVLQSDIDVIWLKNPFPFFFHGRIRDPI